MSSNAENDSREPDAGERRQRHLIAATAALLAGIVAPLIFRAADSLHSMGEATSGGGTSLRVLIAGALPGAAIGAVCWTIIVGFTSRWTDGQRGAIPSLYDSLIHAATPLLASVAAGFGTLGLCGLLCEYTHLEPVANVLRIGALRLMVIGFGAGYGAAVFAHMGIIIRDLQRTKRDTRAKLEDDARASEYGDT